MQAPQHMKDRMHTVLVSCNSKGGLLIDQVDPEYRRQMQHPVPFRELSYHTVEDFLRSIPDVAKMEFSEADGCMRVYGIGKVEDTDLQQKNGQYLPMLQPKNLEENGKKVENSSGPESSSSKQSADQVEADDRGVYTLSFPTWQKPQGQFGTLEDMFGVAGKVFELYETSRWIYVCYKDLAAVKRAFKMFGHLNLKGAPPSALSTARNDSRAHKRKMETNSKHSLTGSSQNIAPKKKKKVLRGGCQRVFIGNLNPAIKYSFDMFRKLFHEYRLVFISLKTSNADPDTPKTYANVLTVDRKAAEKMVEQFDGFVWYGRPLIVAIKNKGANKEKNGSGDDMPGLEPSMPGLEPGMPGLEPGMPGLEPGMPGLEQVAPGLKQGTPGLKRVTPGLKRVTPGLKQVRPGLKRGMPGLKRGMPGLEPGMPGLELGMPGLEPGMPRLEPGMPGLEPGMPGLEPGMPGLKRGLPGLGRGMPRLEPGMPRSKPFLPQLKPAKPGLEPQNCFYGRGYVKNEERDEGPLENLQVMRTFEPPTLLVAHLLEGADEASLRKLFAMYHPSKIRMTAPYMGKRKAFVTLRSVEDAREALHKLDKSIFQGMRLKVDVPYNRPQLRKALGLDRGNSSSTGSLLLSEVLKTRGTLLKALQLPDFSPRLGQRINVLITDVISDKFFWGQVANAIMAEELERISDYLNSVPASDLHQASGPGRCMARFNDGKWYRAWVMTNQLNTDSCRVLYLDYGNTSKVPWNQTARVPERWPWITPPLAIPFTLIDGISDLKTRELTRLTVEINALGSLEEGNMLVVRVVSLLPSMSTQAVSSVLCTIIE